MEIKANGLGVMAVHFCCQLNVVVDDIVVFAVRLFCCWLVSSLSRRAQEVERLFFPPFLSSFFSLLF
jgi:hypothetical protein